MDDLISRQAVIDDIKAIYEYHDTVTEDRILDHLHRLPSAQKWIPVSEGSPEKPGRYLVTNSECEVDWNLWVNGQWLFQNDAPVAWMNLPEPYEGGDA